MTRSASSARLSAETPTVRVRNADIGSGACTPIGDAFTLPPRKSELAARTTPQPPLRAKAHFLFDERHRRHAIALGFVGFESPPAGVPCRLLGAAGPASRTAGAADPSASFLPAAARRGSTHAGAPALVWQSGGVIRVPGAAPALSVSPAPVTMARRRAIGRRSNIRHSLGPLRYEGVQQNSIGRGR